MANIYHQQNPQYFSELAHFLETYLEKYGKEHVSQVHEFSKKAKKKYLFDGQYFDSGPELVVYIWQNFELK